MAAILRAVRATLVFLLPAAILIGAAAAESLPRGFVVHGTPKAIPAFDFTDGDGKALSLADFGGKVVLLNLWATWCGPCRREMPTLDGLQAALGGKDFEVVALSIDRAGADAVDRFYRDVGVGRLAKYLDTSGKAAHAVGAPVLPTTLLIDRKGREIARLVGPAEWDAPEIMAFIRRHIAKEAKG